MKFGKSHNGEKKKYMTHCVTCSTISRLMYAHQLLYPTQDHSRITQLTFPPDQAVHHQQGAFFIDHIFALSFAPARHHISGLQTIQKKFCSQNKNWKILTVRIPYNPLRMNLAYFLKKKHFFLGK